jgi:hypothetical protein
LGAPIPPHWTRYPSDDVVHALAEVIDEEDGMYRQAIDATALVSPDVADVGRVDAPLGHDDEAGQRRPERPTGCATHSDWPRTAPAPSLASARTPLTPRGIAAGFDLKANWRSGAGGLTLVTIGSDG